MKSTYIKTWLLGITSALLLVACTSRFEELNTNPNNATERDLEKDNLFLGAFFVKMIQNIFPYGGTGSTSTNAYQAVENLAGDVFAGYHGQTHNWSRSGDQLHYNFSLEWNGAQFSTFYQGVLGNWDFIKTKTKDQYPDLFAVAQIIKIYAAQRTTDTYGPIPYTQAGEGIGAPYDSQEAIYLSFIEELTEAINTLKPYASRGVSLLQLFDDVYTGNYTQWIKLANSLKLRIAIRMAYVAPNVAQKAAEEAVSDSYGVIIDNSDNAQIRGIAGSGRTYNNPLQGLSESYNEARMGASMESILGGYNDPRIDKFFKPATNPTDQTNSQPRTPQVYLGIRTGIRITDTQQQQYVSFSKLRTDFQILWMTAAETFFLRAEGALRGWNMGETAQALYETGISKSFEQWGASGIVNYTNDSTSKPKVYTDEVNSSNSISSSSLLSDITIKWNESDSFEKNLERIITQKWIAIYPNGQEAWSEFRRTGYPKLFPIVWNASGGTVSTAEQIRRLPYPRSESITNKDNYLKGITLLGGSDTGGTKLWWDKKN